MATENLNCGMNFDGKATKQFRGPWTLPMASFGDLVLAPAISDFAVFLLENTYRTLEMEIEGSPSHRGHHPGHTWGSVYACVYQTLSLAGVQKARVSGANVYASVRDFVVVYPAASPHVVPRCHLLTCACGAKHSDCAAVAVWFLRCLEWSEALCATDSLLSSPCPYSVTARGSSVSSGTYRGPPRPGRHRPPNFVTLSCVPPSSHPTYPIRPRPWLLSAFLRGPTCAASPPRPPLPRALGAAAVPVPRAHA